MNNAQRRFVIKVTVISFLLVLIAVSSWVVNAWLPHEWLAKHGETVKWSAFALFLIIGILARKDGTVPTYSERHETLNHFYDEHPWAKVYLACIATAIAAGLYFVGSHRIDMVTVMHKSGVFGFLGAIFLLFLPNIIVKLKEVYDAAGEED